MMEDCDKFWVTRDEIFIPLSRMGTGHIEASVKMMRNNGYVSKMEYDSYLKTFGSGLSMGDAAEMALEQYQIRMMGKRLMFWIDVMENILKQRTLDESCMLSM